MTVLVASTCRAYKATGPNAEADVMSWLAHGSRWRLDGHRFFLAMQHDGQSDRFIYISQMAETVRQLGGTVWNYLINETANRVTNDARLAGICAGRNLAHEYAQRDRDISHILFLDTDLQPPVDAIDRLLRLDHPVVGGHVPVYCLDGPRVEEVDGDVREHWNTAGFLLVARDVFRTVRWRWDLEADMTDDPAFAHDVRLLGFGPTWVDHEVIGLHPPLVPFDQRGHDLTLR